MWHKYRYIRKILIFKKNYIDFKGTKKAVTIVSPEKEETPAKKTTTRGKKAAAKAKTPEKKTTKKTNTAVQTVESPSPVKKSAKKAPAKKTAAKKNVRYVILFSSKKKEFVCV